MKFRNRIKCYLLLVSLLCLIYAGLCPVARADDWPNWRGPNYDGVSKETGWSSKWSETGPKVLWEASIGTGFSSMAVSNGRVYTIGNINDKDILYCFEADTGKEIWKKSYPCPLYARNYEGGPTSTPTVQGDYVYVFSKNGDCLCFKAATGDVVWHKNIKEELGLRLPTWHFSSSPFIAGDLIILNAGTSGVALKKADGKLVWENGRGPSGYASAAPFTVGGKKCAALFTSRELVGVVIATGERLWEFPWKTDYDINSADPIISGDTVFISSGYDKGCALLKIHEDKVTELWRNRNMRNQCTNSVLWQGHIYGFDGQVNGSGKLTCLNYETGESKWSQKGMGTGSVMIADDKLIILSENGKLVIAPASPDGFRELSSAQILTGRCWTVPVLANGRIYARSAAGRLVCVDVRQGVGK